MIYHIADMVRNNFHAIFTGIEVLVTDAIDKRYIIISGEEFNLILDRGYRGQVMEEFCSAFSMNIANGALMGNDPSM